LQILLKSPNGVHNREILVFFSNCWFF
jgi:hypothetical protein